MNTLTTPTFNFFNLPTIHKSVPTIATMALQNGEIADYVKTLIAIGVIDLRRISKSARTASDILSQGMSRWFTQRTSTLKYVKFDIAVTEAQNIHDRFGLNSGSTEGGLYLMFSCEDEEFYKFKPASIRLEAACPGLTGATIAAIERASYSTIHVRTGSELFDTFAHWNWDGDTEASEEEAREMLIDRFGEESKDIEDHLPSKAKKIFGMDIFNHKQKHIAEQKLTQLATAPRNSLAKRVAAEVIKLQSLTELCEKQKIRFPRMHDAEDEESETVFHGCCLLYEEHAHIVETYDTQINDLYNCGTGTHTVGFAALPMKGLDLLKFFNRVDTSLNLLTQLDKVIGLIATSYNLE